MRRALGKVLSLPGRTWSAVRRRPRLPLLFALLLAAGAAVGVWRYAVRQWGAAQLALKQDRPEEARDRLAFCLRVWPWSFDVHLLAARAARLTGDLAGAETHLNRCLALADGEAERERVQLEFLLVRVQGGEFDELAPVLFDLVEKGHPETPTILFTMARAYLLHTRYKPASACLSRWIEAEPDNPKPFQWRGWTLERLGNEKGARADYLKALELDPDLLPVRLRLVEMMLEDKQVPDALPHLEWLIRQAPDDPRVQARLGMARFHQGRGDEARRLMEAAAPHLPNDPALNVTLANLDVQDGRGADAERRLRAVIAADASDTEALFVLAAALRLQNRTEEAAAVLADYEKKRRTVERINALLKEAADSPKATAGEYAEIGKLFLQIGRNKFGVYWLERALEMDSTFQPAHRALAEHYEQKGEAAKAAVHRRQLR